MIEIIELNKLILAEAPEVASSDDGLTISRKDEPAAWKVLPPRLQQRVETILAELDQHIPEDFSYDIHFGGEEPIFSLSFEDGPQVGMFGGRELKAHESIESHFSKVDWDEERGAAMQNCQFFDHLKEYAESRPTRILSTKSLQRAVRDDLKKWIKEVRTDRSKVFVLMFREDTDFTKEEFANLADFARELPNLMTVEFQVIAVVADGKPIRPQQIDIMKKQALESLKNMPISYAKASGQLAGLFGQSEVEENEE